MFRSDDVNICLSFINDPTRNRWYNEILKAHVKDKIIFEVGYGVGLLAAYCLEHGAKHYYGIDIRDARRDITSNVLNYLGYQDRYTLLTGNFLDLSKNDVPKHIDILLTEQVGSQFINFFTMKRFWNHAITLFDSYITIPDMWSIDAIVYDGIINDSDPTLLLDDKTLPTNFYSALNNIDTNTPAEYIKNVVCITPKTSATPIEFILDLTKYKSATIVLVDNIQFRKSKCRSTSALIDWPNPAKIIVNNAQSLVKFYWNTDLKYKKYTNGYWEHQKI